MTRDDREVRDMFTLAYELGFRVMLHWQTRPRDLRWFRGLFR